MKKMYKAVLLVETDILLLFIILTQHIIEQTRFFFFFHSFSLNLYLNGCKKKNM